MRWTLGVVVLLTLACGGGGPGGALDTHTVGLTEPWASMKLPVEDGAVRFADIANVSIEYPARSVADLAQPYAEAVRNAGWAETTSSEAGGMFTATYALHGRTLTLSVISANAATTVSLVQS